jgi:hypothetical protein
MSSSAFTFVTTGVDIIVQLVVDEALALYGPQAT